MSTCCIYCGIPAVEKDHIHPRARMAARRGDGAVVPACRECNVVLSDKPLFAVNERALFLLQYYTCKWKEMFQCIDSRIYEINKYRLLMLCRASFLPEASRRRYKTKLTTQEVRDIFVDNSTSHDIAKRYNVSVWTIYSIKKRQLWKRATADLVVVTPSTTS